MNPEPTKEIINQGTQHQDLSEITGVKRKGNVNDFLIDFETLESDLSFTEKVVEGKTDDDDDKELLILDASSADIKTPDNCLYYLQKFTGDSGAETITISPSKLKIATVKERTKTFNNSWKKE